MDCPVCGGEIALVAGAARCDSCGWEVTAILDRILREIEEARSQAGTAYGEVALWYLLGTGSGAARTLLELGLLNEPESERWLGVLGEATGIESERVETQAETRLELTATEDDADDR